MELLFSHYGIRRNNPKIWNYYDWFNQRYKMTMDDFSGFLI